MSIQTILSRAMAAYLIVATTAAGGAQQPFSLSKKAEAVKREVEKLPPQSRISVILFHGNEEFGKLISHDQDGFAFRDIDRNIDVTLRYSEVRKVKSGFGGYNFVKGGHTDRTRAMVVTVIVLATIGAVIAAAATARN